MNLFRFNSKDLDVHHILVGVMFLASFFVHAPAAHARSSHGGSAMSHVRISYTHRSSSLHKTADSYIRSHKSR